MPSMGSRNPQMKNHKTKTKTRIRMSFRSMIFLFIYLRVMEETPPNRVCYQVLGLWPYPQTGQIISLPSLLSLAKQQK